MWPCPLGHLEFPEAQVLTSSFFPLYPSVSLPPAPTITTENSRCLQTRQFPGQDHLAPRLPVPLADLATCKTFLPGSAEDLGMGQGESLIPEPYFRFCWQKPNYPLGLVSVPLGFGCSAVSWKLSRRSYADTLGAETQRTISRS